MSRLTHPIVVCVEHNSNNNDDDNNDNNNNDSFPWKLENVGVVLLLVGRTVLMYFRDRSAETIARAAALSKCISGTDLLRQLHVLLHCPNVLQGQIC